MRRFLADESGQSLVFASLTFFALIIMALMIVGVGENTSTQIRLQTAADSAAYAGAQLQADCIAQVAWLNEGMAHIYYHTMRYCVDTGTYAVLAEFKDWHPDESSGFEWDPTKAGLPAPDASDAVIGAADADTKYQEAYNQAKIWVPRGEKWLRRLSQVERSIAAIGPGLVEHQVFYTASANGAERICYFPGFLFLPDGPNKREIELTKVGETNPDPWQENGWTAHSDSEDFDLTATHAHHATAMDDVWLEEATGDVRTKLKDLYHWEPDGTYGWHEGWNVHFERDGNTSDIQVRSRYGEWGESRPADYYIAIQTDGDNPVDENAVAHVDADGNVTVLKNLIDQTTGHDDKGDYKLTITAEGWMVMEYTDGDKVAIKYNDEGVLCEWEDTDKDGKIQDDEFKPLGDATGVDIGGHKIPIDFNPNIQIGGMSINLNQPIRLHFKGLSMSFTNPLRINYHTGLGWLNIRDDRATIAGLSTATADSKWKRINYGQHNQQNHDRIRHRMIKVDDSNWRYEWIKVGSYMSEMQGGNPEAGTETGDMALVDQNMFLRFAVHSLMDKDQTYITASGPDRWSMPDIDDDQAWDDNGSSADTQWRYLPLWARPRRMPDDPADADNEYEYGGWFDMGNGCPYKTPPSGNTTAPAYGRTYHQTRICWYCGNRGTPGPLYDLSKEATDPDFMTRFTRPCGFWWVDQNFGTLEAAETEVQKYIDADAVVVIANDARTGGSYRIQVYCPLHCQREFPEKDGHAPPYTYYPPGTANKDMQTRVRRYLYHAFGRGYNLAGRKVKAIERKMDNGDMTYNNTDQRDFFAMHVNFKDPAHYFAAPLQLTSEIFRNSITVMTYAPSMELGVWSKIGGKSSSTQKRDAGLMNPLENPDWGHYAIATARLFVAKPDSGETVKLMTSFPWDGDPIPGEEPLDPIGRQKNWERQRWLRSSYNLFEPGWTAALAPLRKAIDPRDYYTEDEMSAGDFEDNSSSLILRLLKSSYWRKNITDSGYGWHNADAGPIKGWTSMTAPPMQADGKQAQMKNAREKAMQDITGNDDIDSHLDAGESVKRTVELVDELEGIRETMKSTVSQKKVDWDKPEIEDAVHH